jgi:RHS repeat-associated protein
MRIRPRSVAALVSITALVAVLAPTLATRAGASAAVSYTYDADGRLLTVTNAAGTTATYDYDAAGNVLSIAYSTAGTRHAAARSTAVGTRPSVSAVAPAVVSSGARLTIQGRGFSPDSDADVVLIGKLIAPVDSATSTRLIVTAPPGAGGTVSVKTPGGVATAKSVRIVGARGPDGVAAPVNPLNLRGVRRAAAGVTAISGLVERNDGRALTGIEISISNGWDSGLTTTTTNRSGWFLLPDLTAGSHVLYIDGGAQRYGLYSEPVTVAAGVTTVLPWITYLTPLDKSASVALPAKTTHQVTLTSAKLPGLEVIIPKGTSVTDVSGKPISRISLTALATGRTPFPWAPNMEPPYFTLQPEGARVSGPGIQIVYPNQSNEPPGATLDYLAHNDSWGGSGWYTYGKAHVSANGRQVIPNPGTAYHLIVPGGYGTPPAPGPGPAPGGGPSGGEPVDLQTGLFVMNATDLTLTDVFPVSLTRNYRPLDDQVRTFGIGTESGFDYLVQADSSGHYDLYTPDGSKIVYTPTSTNGLYDATGTPTQFFGSTLVAQGDSDGPFLITLTNGTKLQFSNPAYLISVTDRFGNTIDINRTDYLDVQNGGGQISSVTTPGGQWMTFTYGVCVPGNTPSYCVTSVTDSANKTVKYGYNSSGQLISAVGGTAANSSYTWGACPGTLTCTEILSGSHGGVPFITNTYDPVTGRVTNQTAADGGKWAFSYTTNANGQVTQTVLTDPDGNISDYTFDPNGYESQGITAGGTSDQQSVTPVYDPTTNLLTSYTDNLGRQTTFTYDSLGNMLTETLNANSASPQTYTYTYEPKYNRIASITNPLNQTTTYTYNDSANTITATDPLGHKTVTVLDTAGQPVEVTDPAGDTSYYSYLRGQLVAYADPSGNVTSFYDNSQGDPIRISDPEGNTSIYTWSASGYPVTATDPLGKVTKFSYNNAGELLSITDPDGNKTTYTYDPLLRPLTETDALGKSESVTYDADGQVVSSTDRDGNVSDFTYDSLGRLATAKSGVSGSHSFDTATYTYDAANRLTKVVDALAGTYSFTYDDLNDLLTATNKNGTLTYTYGPTGLETSMTVTGQTKVKYTYNDDQNLTGISQGSTSVTIGYDADQRPISTQLPDGITETGTYNADSLVSSLAYSKGSTSLGGLNYAYDADGQVTSISGSLASTNLPAALSSATYNADNEMTADGATTLSYDPEGNLLTDGTTSYTWNPEDQLASVTAGSTSVSFAYNPFGQRTSQTVGTAKTSYLYDAQDLVQTESAGSPVANILTDGAGHTYQVATTSATVSLLSDRLGSTVGLGSATGTLATNYTYDPYGTTTSSGSSSTNALQYIGAQNDSSTGLYYLNARYLDPSLGRFISQDPIGVAGGSANVYQYGFDQPTDFVDPSGLSAITSDGGGINNGPQGNYHGVASAEPSINGNGLGLTEPFGPAGSSVPETIEATAQTGDSGLQGFAGQAQLFDLGAVITTNGLTPLSLLTGLPTSSVDSWDTAIPPAPTRLLLTGKALAGTRPWSAAFWNGQYPG